jgi:[ribosomal protein S5]-alanine N-acetyltransferase
VCALKTFTRIVSKVPPFAPKSRSFIWADRICFCWYQLAKTENLIPNHGTRSAQVRGTDPLRGYDAPLSQSLTKDEQRHHKKASSMNWDLARLGGRTVKISPPSYQLIRGWRVAAPDVFSEPPLLRTERLVLRQITESDGVGLFGIFSDDEVTKHYAWDTFNDPAQGHDLAARTAEQLRERRAIRWGLVIPDAPDIIGTCGYTRWNQENHFAMLGYDLARPYWHRGLMSETVEAVVRFGFEQMELHRIEATVLTGNTASATLLQRAGFQREGVLRERFLQHGSFRDEWMCSITRPEWADRRLVPPAG